jgi:hypothetical protein
MEKRRSSDEVIEQSRLCNGSQEVTPTPETDGGPRARNFASSTLAVDREFFWPTTDWRIRLVVC